MLAAHTESLPVRRYRIPATWALVRALAWKNVRLRYKGSFLGFLWSLLQPLFFLLIFQLIFSRAFPQVGNYAVFALTGLIFWSYFATTGSHILGSMVEGASVLRTFSVPPIVFPLGQLFAGTLNLLLSFIPFTALLIWLGWRPEWVHLLVLPLVALLATFMFGLGLGLCALNVYFRDIGLLWGALLPALFYVTPIAYPPDLVPAHLQWIAGLNPLFHYIAPLRTLLVDGSLPGAWAWASALAWALLALALGLLVHRRLRHGYVANT